MTTSRNERRRRWFLRAGAAANWLTEWRASLRVQSAIPTSPVDSGSHRGRLWAKFAAETRVPTGVVLEVQRRHSGVTISVPLTDPYLLIGHHPRCGLWLDDGSGDDTLYALFWLNGELFGVDLRCNSTQHTETPLRDGWWSDGQTLRLGDHVLRVRGLPGIPARTVPVDDDSTVTLQLESAAGRTERQLTRWLTLIGCGVDNDVILREQHIAPRQAALIRTPLSLWLINLAHGLPPRIADRNVAWSLLDPLDDFLFGDTKIHAMIRWPEASTTQAVPAIGPDLPETIAFTETDRLIALHAELSSLSNHDTATATR